MNTDFYIKPEWGKKDSGFFKLPITEQCTHIYHNPPQHLYIPPGQGYRHICPSCGKETIITPLQITN